MTSIELKASAKSLADTGRGGRCPLMERGRPHRMSERDDWGRRNKANILEGEKQAAFRARRFAPDRTVNFNITERLLRQSDFETHSIKPQG